MVVKRITLSMSEKIIQLLGKRAEELGLSKSDYVRTLVLNDTEMGRKHEN
jgi:hypothetical protein